MTPVTTTLFGFIDGHNHDRPWADHLQRQIGPNWPGTSSFRPGSDQFPRNFNHCQGGRPLASKTRAHPPRCLSARPDIGVPRARHSTRYILSLSIRVISIRVRPSQVAFKVFCPSSSWQPQHMHECGQVVNVQCLGTSSHLERSECLCFRFRVLSIHVQLPFFPLA